MTTQWTADAYKDVSLSEEKKADCKRIAMILVHEALRHYQKFDRSVPRKVDDDRWKPIKSSGNVTMYRERHPSQRVVKDSYTDGTGWQMPRVIVGNGTISNNIDDILFGLPCGDEAAALQSVSYSKSPVTNAQILSVIEKPTLEHPYRSTFLQWHSASPSPALRGVVKDRDAVYIRATGVLQVSRDERIGYTLMHSIDLPFTPPLEGRDTIRSRISSCILYKPISDQSVEVFIKAYYEVFGNNVFDSIAVVTVASTLMDSWTSSKCAKLKKLSWLLQRKNANKDEVMGFISSTEAESKSGCRCCKKRFGPLRKAYPCTLCESSSCGKCILSVELIDVIPELKLATKKVSLCSTCDQFVSQVNSYKVARQEIRAGRYEKGGSGSTIVEPSRISQLEEETRGLSGTESCVGEVYEFESDQHSPSTTDSLSAFAQLTSTSESVKIAEPKGRSSGKGAVVRGDSKCEDELDTMIENVWRGSISELDLNDQERGRQLAWLKMTELRLREGDSANVGSKDEEKLDA